jgi:hypothetical protein
MDAHDEEAYGLTEGLRIDEEASYEELPEASPEPFFVLDAHMPETLEEGSDPR